MDSFFDLVSPIILILMFLTYISPVALLSALGGFLWFKLPGANLNRYWRAATSIICFLWGVLTVHILRCSWLKGTNIEIIFIILLTILCVLWLINTIWQFLPNRLKSVRAQSYYVWLRARQDKYWKKINAKTAKSRIGNNK